MAARKPRVPIHQRNRQRQCVEQTSEANIKSAYTKAVRSGVLNLQQRGLRQVPLGVFTIDKFVPDENGWWELLVPHTLLLTHNELSELSPPTGYDWVNGWKELQTLNVAYNRIASVPAEILKLELLRKLVCHHNHIRHFAFDTVTSTNLRHLELQHNALQQLDEHIGRCVNLQCLNVSNNELTSLPRALFAECTNLEVLEAANNRIAGDLSRIDFSRCVGLKEVDLANNRICKISTALFQIPSLTRLSLRQNKISEIQITEQKSAESPIIDLYLGSNAIAQFPFDSMRFARLKLLDLSGNAFAVIAPSISVSCPSLERLDVSGNNLQDIPAELALIEPLKSMAITGNPLRRVNKSVMGNSHALKRYLRQRLAVPDAVDESVNANRSALSTLNVNARELRLNQHSLEALPSLLSKMESLSLLELDDNKLSDIADLRHCKALRQLSLKKNAISDISPLFGLARLEVLDVSINRLRDPQMPKSMEGIQIWPTLQTLRLSYNQMRDVSSLLRCIASPAMTTLAIGNNNLSVFPQCVLEWTQLAVLDLANNDLADVPFALGLLERVNVLLLSGNRLRRMQRVINGGNTPQIMAWLRSRIS